MATYIPLTNVATQFFDLNGEPLSGGSLEFYLAGTTTATDLYSDSSGTSIGVSIDLNSLGYPETGGNTIFLFRDQSKAIKILLLDSTDAVLVTMDDIPAVASYDSVSSAKLDGIEEGADVTDAVNVAAAGALMATGGTMTGNITMGSGTSVLKTVEENITASTTQTQGQQPLVSSVNEVGVVANANDVVTMPTAVQGIRCTVINNGANILGIFPAADDDVGEGVDTVRTLAAGASIEFEAINAVTWEDVALTPLPVVPDPIVVAYGMMSVQEGVTAEATTDITPRKIAAFTVDGLALNTTPDATTNNAITIDADGVYEVFAQVSFSGTASKTYHLEIYSNTTPSTFEGHRKLGTAGDVGSASCMGLLTLSETDQVSVYHYTSDGGTAFTVSDAQLIVNRIG